MLEKIKGAVKDLMFFIERIFWKSQRFLARLMQSKN